MARITGEDILKIALANPDVIVPLEALNTGKAKAGKSKYNNVRCEFNNLKFDSKAEMIRYTDLRLLELTGQISNLRTQPVYELPSGVKYKGDFEYIENGQVVCEEVKGFETASWKIKKKSWRSNR
jgi:hypothetical protein